MIHTRRPASVSTGAFLCYKFGLSGFLSGQSLDNFNLFNNFNTSLTKKIWILCIQRIPLRNKSKRYESRNRKTFRHYRYS